MDSFDSVRSFAERLGSCQLAQLPFQRMTKAYNAYNMSNGFRFGEALDMLLQFVWGLVYLVLALRLLARRYIESIGTHDT